MSQFLFKEILEMFGDGLGAALRDFGPEPLGTQITMLPSRTGTPAI